MGADFFYGLLPNHLVLGLMLGLMLQEILRAKPGMARASVVLVLVAAVLALVHQWAAGYASEVIAGEVRIDSFAIAAKLVLVGCALVLALGFKQAQGHKFWLLISASLLGGMLVMDSAGFATLFLGIELLSLPAFALMVLGQRSGVAAEGAFKYLLLSSVASALLLFGISLSYGATASLTLQALREGLATGGPHQHAAALLVLSGLFLKAAVFPFHAWAPDAYASARLPVTAYLASLLKVAAVLALARILGDGPLPAGTGLAVATLAILSILYGNLTALGQPRLRRLLAYSSVAHAGYMVFALTDTTGQRSSDLLWYSAFYAGGTLLACASFSALSREGDSDELTLLDGRYAAQPLAALLFALSVLSLAGLPPFPGFFAKLFVFQSVVASGYLWAAVVAFVGSFLGLAYYVSMAMRVFRAPGTPALQAEVGVSSASGTDRSNPA